MRVLALGAHPDDLEIGAAGLLQRLSACGHEIQALILSLEHEERYSEAQRGMETLGVPVQQLLFAGYPDGHVLADRSSIDATRRLIGALGSIDLVVTHSDADSHPDHVAANRLARAAVRGSNFLWFSVYLSVELPSFRPVVYLELSARELATKDAALACHATQRGRLERFSLLNYKSWLGSRESLGPCEAFEYGRQFGARDIRLEISSLCSVALEDRLAEAW